MIQKIHFVGMGALGLLFAKPILDHLNGRELAFIMDEERLKRHREDVYKINGEVVHFRMLTPENAAEESPADLVFLGVKYPEIHKAIDNMKGSVGGNTTIISMMNGIDSEELLAERYGKEKVLYSVAQEMDAQRFGTELIYVSPGRLIMGVPDSEEFDEETRKILKAKLAEVKAFFDEVGIVGTIEEKILNRLWSKFMLNVGCNQTSLVYHCGFGKELERGSEEFAIMTGAMREVIVIAQAKGIPIGEKDLNSYLTILGRLSPEAYPSMGQDGLNKRKSEVDMFAGVVMRLGDELGIETPINDYIYRRVKEIEAEY